MELKISGKKTGMPVRATARKSQAGPGSKGPLACRPREDRLLLSRQVLTLLEQRNRENWRRSQQPEEEQNEDRLLDSLKRELKTMKTCDKIAARIRGGDRVPPEDLRYLMKYDPAGYRLAMAMRKPKQNPKEWESALDDAQKQQEASAPAAGTLSAAMAAGGKPAGGIR